jgi:hypothetical protein
MWDSQKPPPPPPPPPPSGIGVDETAWGDVGKRHHCKSWDHRPTSERSTFFTMAAITESLQSAMMARCGSSVIKYLRLCFAEHLGECF